MTHLSSFITRHAFVHTDAVAQSFPYSLPESIIDDLTDAQFRWMHRDTHSILWHLWHTAIVEDFGYSLLAGLPMLIDDESFKDEIGTEYRDPNHPKEAARQLAQEVSINTILAYRDAVGQRTQDGLKNSDEATWLSKMRHDDLDLAIRNCVISSEEKTGYVWLIDQVKLNIYDWWGYTHTVLHLGQATTVAHLIRAEN